MKPALSALSTSPNDCTRLLLRFITLLDNHTIIELWKTEALDVIKSRELDQPLRLQNYNALSIARYIQRQCQRSDMVIFSLWKSLKRAAKKSILHKENILSSSKVADFCIRAGCPSVTRYPVKNVERLRAHLATRSSAIREAELRREIEELRSENQRQQRIISNLTFRHLLENLPPAREYTDSHVQRLCHVHVMCSRRNSCSCSCHVMCSMKHKVLALYQDDPKLCVLRRLRPLQLRKFESRSHLQPRR